MKIVLQPLHTFTTRDGRKIYEQILLRSEEGYPFAIVHIDSVASGDAYDDLYYRGKQMSASVVIDNPVVIEPLDVGEGGEAVR